MKISQLMKMIGQKLVDSVSGPIGGKPDFSNKRLSRDWALPEKPSWGGFLTGKTDPKTGVSIPGVRPHWRAVYVGDRSKYKPHQGAGECARRVRQMKKGLI